MTKYQDILEYIWSKDSKVIDIKKEICNFLHDGSKSEVELIELSEKYFPRVLKNIRFKINKQKEKGVTPKFDFGVHSDETLIGYDLFEKDDQIIAKLQCRSELKIAIDNLKWELFENLCKYILSLNNFKNTKITGRTKDGGLDFIGYYIPYADFEKYLGVLVNLNIRVFGQSKQRKKCVGANEVREFYTHYLDFLNEKGDAYKYINKNESWYFTLNGPIVPFFFTNSVFTKGAINFAHSKGIELRDGNQLVEDLIRLHISEPWFLFKDNCVTFSEDEFIKHLNF